MVRIGLHVGNPIFGFIRKQDCTLDSSKKKENLYGLLEVTLPLPLPLPLRSKEESLMMQIREMKINSDIETNIHCCCVM